ncbi:hypothetical protein B0H16DRAFT_1478006 [Mycena metata]|uniref:Uncharacterized protein n=1 Tax=Mycena metata TaxID=1033252 RepID=A0AAD7H854_9AGAR|nr:hypothetical protein B0H16DRAFT_1478006 [Mycena metata]
MSLNVGIFPRLNFHLLLNRSLDLSLTRIDLLPGVHKSQRVDLTLCQLRYICLSKLPPLKTQYVAHGVMVAAGRRQGRTSKLKKEAMRKSMQLKVHFGVTHRARVFRGNSDPKIHAVCVTTGITLIRSVKTRKASGLSNTPAYTVHLVPGSGQYKHPGQAYFTPWACIRATEEAENQNRQTSGLVNSGSTVSGELAGGRAALARQKHSHRRGMSMMARQTSAEFNMASIPSKTRRKTQNQLQVHKGWGIIQRKHDSRPKWDDTPVCRRFAVPAR